MKAIMDFDEHFPKALKAYFAQAEKTGYIMLQPSAYCSTMDVVYINLRNGSHLLGRYNYHTGKMK
jgi:hypothetical protein